MATRSIIDVEVNDEAFRNFHAMFKKYQDAVTRMPGAWGNVDKSTKNATKSFDDLVRASEATAKSTAAIALNQEKLTRSVVSSDRASESLARNTGKIAGNIGAATVSLLKWTGIIGAVGGLLGAGGLWGIERLATSAAGARRDAGGIGVTSGQSEAFELNYRRVTPDPRGLLENVANAKSDYADRWAFNSLGIQDAEHKDAAQLAEEVLRNGRRMFANSDQSQQFAESRGLLKFGSMDMWRNSTKLSDQEMDEAARGYRSDSKSLAVDPAAQKAWTEFNAQLERAGAKIENVFITGLAPLAGPIGKLSDSLSNVIQAFAKSSALKIWLDDLGKGLDHFATYVGSDSFKTDVEDFANSVRRMAKAIVDGLKWLGLIPSTSKSGGSFGSYGPQLPFHDPSAPWGAYGPPNPKETRTQQVIRQNITEPLGLDHDGQNAWLANNTPDRNTVLIGSDHDARVQKMRLYLKKEGHSDEDIAAIMGSAEAESGFNPQAFNPAGGGEGAQGIFQWRGDRIKQFERLFNKKLKNATFDEQIQHAEWELEHNHKQDMDLTKDAKTLSEKTKVFRREYEDPGVDPLGYIRAQQFAHDEIWKQFGRNSDTEDIPDGPNAPAPQQNLARAGLGVAPQRVGIDIKNTTGGSASVTVHNAAAY